MKRSLKLILGLCLSPLFMTGCDPSAADAPSQELQDPELADLLDREAQAQEPPYEASKVDLAATGSVCTKWTPWFDRDDPSGIGDFEDRDLHGPGVCDQPTAVECRTTAGDPLWVGGEQVECSTELVRCLGASQPDGACQFDYKVRFLCPCPKPKRKPAIEYRAHVKDKAWLKWVVNGATAGETGQNRRMEAFQVKLKHTPEKMQVCYRAHSASKGWSETKCDGRVAGTTGESLRMEAAKVWLINAPGGCSVTYRAHVKNLGWLDWQSDGEIAGTTGESRRMEAIQIKLKGC